MALRLMGWKTTGRTPNDKKYILIAAPHSSNWDFVFFMLVVFKLQIPVNWMAKHTMFAWPFGWLLKKIGGIPVNRSIRNNTVRVMADAFKRSDRLILTIAPSGTRSSTTQWKSGFYHIARKARVPIACGFMDYRSKTAGIGPKFFPTGNIETDMADIKKFYIPFSGKYRPRS